jgi:integrase
MASSILTDRLPPAKPKLLDRVRWHMRVKHYSIRTEESYVDWIRRFIVFHRKRHPDQMGEEEIAEFLSHLAKERRVSASIQNQAFSALLFLYQQVLERKLEFIGGVERVTRPACRPVVLTKEEVRAVLKCAGEESAKCGQNSGARTRHYQAGELSYVATFFCDASAGKRVGHKNGAGVVRAQGCEHDDDLYACA